MNILIVKLSAIGDVIHTLPASNALRKAYPSANITWLVEEAASSIVTGHPSLDRVIVSKRKSWIKDMRHGKTAFTAVKEAGRFIKELRDTHYDMILDFQALLKSAILIAISKGKRKIGFDRGMEHQEQSFLFLNERVEPVDMNIHAIERSLMMLDAIGVHSRNIEYLLPIGDDERKTVDDILCKEGMDLSKPLICINPVAKWTTKLWPNDRFARLADILSDQYNIKPVFTGSADDQSTVQEILSQMKYCAVDLTGKTSIKTLAALYEKATLLISTDTGPMHLCAAVETPVAALFGPTAPWRTGPMGDIHQLIRTEIPCSPCFKRNCQTIECMNNITVDQVLDAVARVMKKYGLTG